MKKSEKKKLIQALLKDATKQRDKTQRLVKSFEKTKLHITADEAAWAAKYHLAALTYLLEGLETALEIALNEKTKGHK